MINYESLINMKLGKIPSEIGFEKLEKFRQIQIKFLIDAFHDNINSSYHFRECVKSIFEITSLKIAQFSIRQIDKGLVVISNHIGVNKLTKIYPEELIQQDKSLCVNLPSLENDDPFTMLLAPVVATLSKAMVSYWEMEIIIVFMKLAPVYEQILQSMNAVTIERNDLNQYIQLKSEITNKVEIARKINKKPIVIIFPEGGTSGKSNAGEPYSLLHFKSGYKRLAQDFGFEILPIAISVDPDINFHANIGGYLSLDTSTSEDREYFKTLLVDK